jgi:aconitate hydratase 2/2-methylisocitrate dehydratase
VYLSSAELASVGAILGRIPNREEYLEYMSQIDATASDTYRYLNFHLMGQYTEKADTVIFQEPA